MSNLSIIELITKPAVDAKPTNGTAIDLTSMPSVSSKPTAWATVDDDGR